MTCGFIEALWCLSSTRQVTWYVKTMLKILVDRALMHHISFPSVRMVFALTLDRFIRHNNLCKETVSRSRSIRNLFSTRIEPMSRQNKFDSGWFSTLSTCANEAVVRDYCIILTWSFAKTKGFFCFSFNNRCRLENWGLFLHTLFLKNEEQTSQKNTGCVSI